MSDFTPGATAHSKEPDPTKHVKYTLGMVLGVDDFTQEFAYLSGRNQWLARDLLGYGTVCGLKVMIEEGDEKGPRVMVTSGVALSPAGKMIRVASAQCASLNEWLAAHKKDIPGSPPEVTLYVVLSYRECPTDPVPIPGEPCRSEEESMANSRLSDDFNLELSFTAPDQREEKALRDFVAWLRQIEITDTGVTLKEFEDAIRNALQPLSSPPGSPPSPPSDFMFGSPPAFLRIPASDLCEYLRAAFRIWVTELRPKWRIDWFNKGQGCGCSSNEDSLLLAELRVPLEMGAGGEWKAGDISGIDVVDEKRRPYLIHLRMLQEWLLCGRQEAAPGSPPSSMPPASMPMGKYLIVASGIVKGNGTVRQPVYNGLSARVKKDSHLLVKFNGYKKPNGFFQYIVKAITVFNNEVAKNPAIAFVSFEPDGDGFLLNIRDGGKTIKKDKLSELELMIEVSQYLT